jgi:hypothetical protein
MYQSLLFRYSLFVFLVSMLTNYFFFQLSSWSFTFPIRSEQSAQLEVSCILSFAALWSWNMQLPTSSIVCMVLLVRIWIAWHHSYHVLIKTGENTSSQSQRMWSWNFCFFSVLNCCYSPSW